MVSRKQLDAKTEKSRVLGYKFSKNLCFYQNLNQKPLTKIY